MEILEYDEVDPLDVLQLNLMALDFALTPERVKLIRQYDTRAFPCFAIYASINNVITGQVGLFRLPMVSINGPEDVGGVWAVSTHPEYKRKGIATRLLNEAHERMRTEGLRFSTLGTSSFRLAYSLYLKCGYQDVFSSTSILLPQKLIPSSFIFTTEQASQDNLHLADSFFSKVSKGALGFSHRFDGFLSTMCRIGEIAMGPISEHSVWFINNEGRLVGYAIVSVAGSILKIHDILLASEVSVVDALPALIQNLPCSYVHIKSTHSSVTRSLIRLGGRVVPQDWSTFMIKSLTKDVMKLDLKSHFGIGTDKFLFSWLDST
ncbi:MAG: GNAT family N-acetyltransferase [Candidatus Heimdallarchaeota archaeon]|nr:MAG: GNAT family N-acetyltransferase [Candidatus Heimdallarchaeota archaeon]